MPDENQERLRIALERANQRKPSPTAFELKNLFAKQEWKALPKDVRRALGQQFSSVVQQGKLDRVRYDGENSSHHNMYIKN